ncbi:dis3 like 3'-5' exoribonuclease 2 [Anticarsia gemmatalis]|uniref:dis3 like 3'-5' exoribonuclease 2 n=1 Tax=Anticarsia gemmatalis TaxID=129554 RepID=UPI003F768DF8
MSHLCDSISERNIDVNRPSSSQQSTSQPFRSKSSVNNRIPDHQASTKPTTKKSSKHSAMSRHKQPQGEAGGSQTHNNSSVSNLATACQNLNINNENSVVNQGDSPKNKHAKKKEKKLKQLKMPAPEQSVNMTGPRTPQSSQSNPGYSGTYSEYTSISVQDFFSMQVSPLYAYSNTRYLENLSHHPQYQLAHNIQVGRELLCAQLAASAPNTPHLQSQRPHSVSIPNSPVLQPEYISPKCFQNVMQHPLLSQTYTRSIHTKFGQNARSPKQSTSVGEGARAQGGKTGQNNTTPKHNRKNKKKPRSGSDLKFEPYLTPKEVEVGLKNNTLIEGVIRINPKQFQHSYVSGSDRSEQDILIDGIRYRNRALEGDIVVVQLIESDNENEEGTKKDSAKKGTTKEGTTKRCTTKKSTTKEGTSKQGSSKMASTIEDTSMEGISKEGSSIEDTSEEGSTKGGTTKEDSSKEENSKEAIAKEETSKEGQVSRPKDKNQKRGKVVFIKEVVHNRTCIGNLRIMPDNNRQRALFVPRDHRIPRLNIPFTCWPDNFYADHKNYESTLFLAHITDWTDTRFAVGTILRNIGQSGDMVSETRAILAQTDLDITPFGKEVRHLYPRLDYKIPEEEFLVREDCRKLCLFSIDPPNCRDIDDAVSCRELENGNYEIGVHIADVSHFLTEDTILDEKVAEKATTIYLVERAYHMLPDDLCMLCSLFPGVDKLAFSVFWEITKDAKVIDHRFAKTVINSCAQLAYDHAQAVLDDKEDAEASFPETYNGFTFSDIYKVIKALGSISATFRKNRFDGGALRIDQAKVAFHLNPSNGLPDAFCIYENKESHQLIEEFMLLANMTVANRIHKDHPSLAFLRCHPPPSSFMMKQLAKSLSPMGIEIDISSAGNLHRSLLHHIGQDSKDGKAMVLNMLCAKPMSRAKYFCADGCEDDDFHHYALNVPLYTHFTSPIRRYADIMVHRLLAASLHYRETPNWDVDRVRTVAAQCNKQKYNAKKAGELSTELYTLKYIELNSPVVTEAAVVEVRDKYIDVIIIAMGLNRRIFFNNDFPGTYECIKHEGGARLSKMQLWWKADKNLPAVGQVVEVFSVLKVELYKDDDLGKIDIRLVRPQ